MKQIKLPVSFKLEENSMEMDIAHPIFPMSIFLHNHERKFGEAKPLQAPMRGYPDASANHFSQVHTEDKLLNGVIATELEKAFTAVQKYIYLSRPTDGK